MYALSISLLVFVLMLVGALAGVAVRPLLLEKHVHPDSREVVKMATGLVGTLAALVLGLLISSAKSSFDQKTGQVRQMTATIILLDDLLGNMVRRRLLSGLFCGRAFRRWPIAFGTKVRLRRASLSFSSRRPNRRLSKTNWNACRPTMMRNVPCSPAPFRPSRKERRSGCSCSRTPAVRSRRRF